MSFNNQRPANATAYKPCRSCYQNLHLGNLFKRYGDKPKYSSSVKARMCLYSIQINSSLQKHRDGSEMTFTEIEEKVS